MCGWEICFVWLGDMFCVAGRYVKCGWEICYVWLGDVLCVAGRCIMCNQVLIRHVNCVKKKPKLGLDNRCIMKVQTIFFNLD